jgi:hypothetical protein
MLPTRMFRLALIWVQGGKVFDEHGGLPLAVRSGYMNASCITALVHELQPDALADVVGAGAAQLVPAADGPDRVEYRADNVTAIPVSGAARPCGRRGSGRTRVRSLGCAAVNRRCFAQAVESR